MHVFHGLKCILVSNLHSFPFLHFPSTLRSGSKVLACRYCTLDLHGRPFLQTWTRLSETSPSNSSYLHLERIVDWEVGSYLVVASTDHNMEHAEEVQVAELLNNGYTVRLTKPLRHTHQGDDYLSDEKSFPVKAEVGLLSRNIVIRGDESSQMHQFGVTIMLFSPGDESLIGRIENVEVTAAGQAFRLGRYPIHFHMIGNVKKSYIRSNSVHRTFNRAVTIHGVHHLRVQRNVAFDTMGRKYFAL